MENSYLLARIFGIMLIVIVSSIVLNQEFYQRLWQDVSKHPVLLVLSGFIMLLCGLLVVNVHNVWKANWQGLITVLGWLLIIGGVIRIVIPDIILQISQKIIEEKFTLNIIAIVVLLLGIYLTYIGFNFIARH